MPVPRVLAQMLERGDCLDGWRVRIYLPKKRLESERYNSTAKEESVLGIGQQEHEWARRKVTGVNWLKN